MTAPPTYEWPRPQDEAWGERVRARLATRPTVSDALTQDVLAEARQACVESGRSPVELFGEADAYADEVARSRVAIEVRADADLDGTLVRNRGRDLLMTAGGTGLVVSLATLIREGWSAEVTPALLALLAGVLLGWLGATWGLAQRRAGLLRAGWVSWWAGAAALAGGVALALMLRDRPALGDLPTLLPLLTCLGLVAVASRLPSHVGEDEGEGVRESDDEWFDRLDGVLRGRYHLPQRDVRRHVAEAQVFWQDSGAVHPRDEFGSPQVYALRLLEDSPRPRAARRRLEALGYTAMTAIAVSLLAGSLTDGDTGGVLLWRTAVLALFGSLAVRAWLRSR